MDGDDITPLSVGNDAPFSGPDPDEDELVSTRPETDSEIDEQEYYDEGLAGAAELDGHTVNNSDAVDLPDGFHVEG